MQQAESQPATGDTSFKSVLAGLAGSVVTIVNPESFVDAPLGRRLTSSVYRAKVLSVEKDYLCLATEFEHKSVARKDKEPVRQFVPIGRIKRISLLAKERMIHL